jgi:hypothetical protein
VRRVGLRPVMSTELTVHFQSRDEVMCENRHPLPTFPGLKGRHRYAATQHCDWHCGSHSSTSTSSSTSFPTASSRLEHRVSVFPFFFSQIQSFFLDFCFCPLLVSLSKFMVRVVLYLAFWLPVWLPRLLPTGVATGQSLGP